MDLDPLVRFELQREFREIVTSQKKTVLLVTHDLAEAGFLGDEVVLLDDGQVVQQGPYRDLLEAPADDFVTRFVEAQRTPEECIFMLMGKVIENTDTGKPPGD